MNEYETIFILKNNENKEKSIEFILNYLLSESKIKRIDFIGKKQLAYKIKNEKFGYFMEIFFEAEKEVIKNLENRYKRDGQVIKYLTVKLN